MKPQSSHGERQPASGTVAPYTTIPNAFLDLLMADCTGSEVKVVLYIARRTFGTEKGRKNGSDAIALSQVCDGIVKKDGTRLDRGTGLAREAAVEALRRLEFAKIVERERGNGRTPDTWKIAADLPSVKAKAPEKPERKRFENRTGSGSKIELQTGSKIEPVAVRKSNPQKKGLNHHQKEREKESSVGEVSGTPEAAENPKPKPFFSQSDDDSTQKPPVIYASPEAELQDIYRQKTGEEISPDVERRIWETVELRGVPRVRFMDELRKHVPNAWKKPAGFLTNFARKIRSVSTPESKPIAPAEPEPPKNKQGRCAGCSGSGYKHWDADLASREYCDCHMGRELKRVDERMARETTVALEASQAFAPIEAVV